MVYRSRRERRRIFASRQRISAPARSGEAKKRYIQHLSVRPTFPKPLAVALLILPRLSIRAAELDQEQKALGIIAEFADKFCKNINPAGSAKSTDVSADAKAELKGLVSKVADWGFEGAAKYKSESYAGLIQTDLLPALKDNNACRLQIWKDLKGKLLQSPPFGSGKATKRSASMLKRRYIPTRERCPQGSPMTVIYGLVKDAKQSAISPDVGYLTLVRNGGPTEPIGFTWTPFKWDFPSLDIKVVNNTDKTILIDGALIEVERSQLEPEPILLIKPDTYRSNSLHFPIFNEGWSAANEVKIAFNLDPLKGSSQRFSEPFRVMRRVLQPKETP
jgi:hypothetical protein